VYGGARVHEVLLLWLCEEVFGRCRIEKPTPGNRLRGCLGIGVLFEELSDQAIQTPAQQSMRQGMQQSAAVWVGLMCMRLWVYCPEVKTHRRGSPSHCEDCVARFGLSDLASVLFVQERT
jgi:hypothetical protein